MKKILCLLSLVYIAGAANASITAFVGYNLDNQTTAYYCLPSGLHGTVFAGAATTFQQISCASGDTSLYYGEYDSSLTIDQIKADVTKSFSFGDAPFVSNLASNAIFYVNNGNDNSCLTAAASPMGDGNFNFLVNPEDNPCVAPSTK
ncbi:MAG: hypothetical protein RL017_755 [Pseudomonadota bacterium]